jgi:hypothetical protein
MKLIPQFSIRLLLLMTAIAAMCAWVGSQAVQGVFWAIAITLALVFVVVLFGVYALTFLVAWPLAQYTQRWGSQGESPFLENPTLPTE